jgi:hypothetical protein
MLHRKTFGKSKRSRALVYVRKKPCLPASSLETYSVPHRLMTVSEIFFPNVTLAGGLLREDEEALQQWGIHNPRHAGESALDDELYVKIAGEADGLSEEILWLLE